MNRQDRLIQFAKDVLQILEDDPEWSSDTTQAIADAAHNAGLTCDSATFKVTT